MSLDELVFNGNNVHLDDSRWHWIEFNKIGPAVTLKVDGKTFPNVKIPGKSFQLNVEDQRNKAYLGGGPTGAIKTSHTKMNFSGLLREFYYGDMELLDYVVPTTKSQQFEIVGTVINSATIIETSGSGCDPFDDDEDSSCAPPDPSTPSTGRLYSGTQLYGQPHITNSFVCSEDKLIYSL